MKYAIGIDLGGTNIKAVAVTASGEILHKCSCPSRDSLPPTGNTNPYWAEGVRDLAGILSDKLKSAPDYAGLCAPGLAAADGRSIAFMPGRLAGLEGFNWSDYLGLAVPVLEDAKAALLGEVWQGAAAGCRNAIMLTLGTGVGGAIYADGRLLLGQIGRAGNLGHITLDVDAPCDITGMPGSLENTIGECTVKERSSNKFASSKELVEAVSNGDQTAAKVWDRAVYKLACAIASLINVIDPEIVVIGGGIARAGALLYEPLDRHLARIEWRPNGHRACIVPALLGEWAGSIGAAYNALISAEGLAAAKQV
jgi:glucokinase